MLIPGQPQLASDGPHLLEIRNRAERQTAGTTHRLRFKQLVVHERSATLRTIQYTYDGLARLREARYLPGLRTSAPDADLLRREQFTFDRAGNRTQQSIALNGGAPTVTSYSYNAVNQMISDGTNSYTYDNNGNLTTPPGGVTHVWDRANRLASVNVADATRTYSYDGDGRMYRWRSFTPSIAYDIVDQYLLDVQPGLAVFLSKTRTVTQSGSSFSDSERYVYSPRGIHGQQYVNGGNWYWAIQDGLGSVRGGVNNSVEMWGSQSYSPFGEILDQMGNDGIEHGFTGEILQGDDLLYLRARHYDPAIGIFVSEDPLETPNRYAYVGGNPVNRVDPSGMVFENPGDGCCPQVNLLQYLPDPDYSTTNLDDSYVTESPLFSALLTTALIASPVPIASGRDVVSQTMHQLAQVAALAGNDDAARTMRHFLGNSGAMLNFYPVEVEKILRELPLWRQHISENLSAQASALFASQGIPGFSQNEPCEVRSFHTSQNGWIRVGQGSASVAAQGLPITQIFSRGFNLSPGGDSNVTLEDIQQFITNPQQDPSDLRYLFSPGAIPGATREEFDWFLAMNAFDWSVGWAMQIDKQANSALMCFRIDIHDLYGWYVNQGTGLVDKLMAGVDVAGLGAPYEIMGRSGYRCVRRSILTTPTGWFEDIS
jgi:RHS repeat-associated protein